MACKTHDSHSHQHGPGCGHTSIEHEGHTDYLHDGHIHHLHEGHVDEHVIAIDAGHPVSHTAEHNCGSHKHGPGCGHETIPHGDHIDYLVEGHLHHPAGARCHDHGQVKIKAA